jgi:hypothetical protein
LIRINDQYQGLNCVGALNALTSSSADIIGQRVNLAEGLHQVG